MLRVCRHDDPEGLRVTEFHHDLAAHTTGHGIAGWKRLFLFSANDTDCVKIPDPLAHSLCKSSPFGAERRSIGCIFNITACKHCAVSRQQGRADPVVGIRRIRTSALGSRCFNQVADHFVVHIFLHSIPQKNSISLQRKPLPRSAPYEAGGQFTPQRPPSQ